jgi:hypothetical protein
MHRNIRNGWAVILFAMFASHAAAQDALPYKDGAVIVITSVRTQPGKFDQYFRYLGGPYTQMMNEAKQQGMVTSYSFLAASPRSVDDPDLYIIETYPNMAVFDTMTEKMSVLSKKVFGSLKQADEADANREEIRKILGTEMVRELLPVK